MAGKAGAATEELQYLINFSNSITQCVAKAMEHLTDSTFVSMAILSLCRRDKGRSHGQSDGRRDNRFHPYKRLDR